jgi:hypothetical protein
MHTSKSITISRRPSPKSDRYTTVILSQLLLCSCYLGRGEGNQDLREKLLEQESDDGHGLHPIEFYIRESARSRTETFGFHKRAFTTDRRDHNRQLSTDLLAFDEQ